MINSSADWPIKGRNRITTLYLGNK